MSVKVYDPAAARQLFDALKTRVRGGELVKVTSADAVALTGMPSAQAEPALKSLVRDYRSHLAVTDEGELVYEFDPSFERRDRVPLGERLRKVGQAAWTGFSFVFKIWIVVTLVAYVVAFVAMMIGLTVAGRSDRDDRRGGGGFGLPWIWYWMMPDLAPRHDDWGRRVVRQNDAPKKRFYQSVFDFVFGPKRPPADPRALEKELIAFLRVNRGRVTAAELAALTGLGLDDADEELTRLMAQYDGEVEVADDGTLLYVFDALLKSVGREPGSWSWDFDKKAPVESLTGNTPGANAVAGGFAGFNLLASFTIAPAFLARFHLADAPWALFLTLWFPLVFSLIFFAVPAARALARRSRQKKLAHRNLRRALWKEIWRDPGVAREPGEMALLAATRAGAPVEQARAELELLLKELEGDVDTDEEGRIRYRFSRLANERAAVQKARSRATLPQVGRVIFSSET